VPGVGVGVNMQVSTWRSMLSLWGGLVDGQVRLETLRRGLLGAHLATYRRAAGVSQPELGQAVGRTRSTVSKIEYGTRGMFDAQLKQTDSGQPLRRARAGPPQ
jgi:DNA-binding XRE family transcriptional regulator